MTNEHRIPKKTQDDYWDAKQFLDHCRNFGFTLEGVIDRVGKDIDAAERLLIFVDLIEKGLRVR